MNKVLDTESAVAAVQANTPLVCTYVAAKTRAETFYASDMVKMSDGRRVHIQKFKNSVARMKELEELRKKRNSA